MRKPNTKCLICGKGFYAKPKSIREGQGKFCSRKCYHSICKKNVYPFKKKCECCNAEFVVLSRNFRKRKFCSNSCAVKVSNRNRKGKKYKQDVNVKSNLISQYGKKCMIPGCNYSNCVDIHHVQHRSLGGENSTKNCLLLCPNHHREVHMKLIDVDLLKEILKHNNLEGLAHMARSDRLESD